MQRNSFSAFETKVPTASTDDTYRAVVFFELITVVRLFSHVTYLTLHDHSTTQIVASERLNVLHCKPLVAFAAYKMLKEALIYHTGTAALASRILLLLLTLPESGDVCTSWEMFSWSAVGISSTVMMLRFLVLQPICNFPNSIFTLL